MNDIISPFHLCYIDAAISIHIVHSKGNEDENYLVHFEH